MNDAEWRAFLDSPSDEPWHGSNLNRVYQTVDGDLIFHQGVIWFGKDGEARHDLDRILRDGAEAEFVDHGRREDMLFLQGDIGGEAVGKPAVARHG